MDFIVLKIFYYYRKFTIVLDKHKIFIMLIFLYFMFRGLLVSYTYMKQFKGKDFKLMIKNLAKFYLRRYWRISIPLFFMMLFCIGLNRYVHNGIKMFFYF